MLIDKPKVLEIHKVEKRAKLLCVQFIKLALLVMENQIISQNSKSKIRISLLKIRISTFKNTDLHIRAQHFKLQHYHIYNVHKYLNYGLLYKIEKI